MSSKLKLRENKYFKEDIDPYNPAPFYKIIDELRALNPQTVKELDEFLLKLDEITSKINDIKCETYFKMTCNTNDKEMEDKFKKIEENIVAYYAPYEFEFKNIIFNSNAFSKWTESLGDKGLLIKKILENDISIFRKENVEISVKEQNIAIEYRKIIGSSTVNFKGEDKTLVEMFVYFENTDRVVREEAFREFNKKMFELEDNLNCLFDKLLSLRVDMAKNAGFLNYRDYMHKLKGRFSYSVEDVYNFHNAVKEEVLPFICELNEKRKNMLKIDSVRPWDAAAPLYGKTFVPVKDLNMLVNVGIDIMTKTDKEFGENFKAMNDTNLLDLLNRKNKAPGGYSYDLNKYGAAYIFMNAVGLQSDIDTLVHEVGHAMHSFRSVDNKYRFLLNIPMEAAELASMSMEMLTMDNWDVCYDEDTLKKVKRIHLENALKFLPWCMTVDKFQQRIYTDSDTREKRDKVFIEIMNEFSKNAGINWTGLENYKKIRWLIQLHIFDAPFYYIEYGIAQLGAIAVYREYKKDNKKALENYKKFLSLGYDTSLSNLYEACGIRLSFTKEYIKDIVAFVKEEISLLD